MFINGLYELSVTVIGTVHNRAYEFIPKISAFVQINKVLEIK